MALESPIDASHGWFTGEDHQFEFVIYVHGTTAADDITGWTLSFMVKRLKTDPDVDAVITKTTASGIALTIPSSGICTVTILSADTLNVDDGVYWYELTRTNTGLRRVCAYGSARLLPSLHKN